MDYFGIPGTRGIQGRVFVHVPYSICLGLCFDKIATPLYPFFCASPPNNLFKNPKKRILAIFVKAFPVIEILTRIIINVNAKEKIFTYDSSNDSN